MNSKKKKKLAIFENVLHNVKTKSLSIFKMNRENTYLFDRNKYLARSLTLKPNSKDKLKIIVHIEVDFQNVLQ